jgi:hypothetical protein
MPSFILATDENSDFEDTNKGWRVHAHMGGKTPHTRRNAGSTENAHLPAGKFTDRQELADDDLRAISDFARTAPRSDERPSGAETNILNVQAECGGSIWDPGIPGTKHTWIQSFQSK